MAAAVTQILGGDRVSPDTGFEERNNESLRGCYRSLRDVQSFESKLPSPACVACFTFVLGKGKE